LGFQVNILSLLAGGSFLCLSSSCSNSSSQHDPLASVKVFSDRSIEILNEELGTNQQTLKLLQFELEWLNVRKKIVAAEILAKEARESELKLERELSNFQKLDSRFPSSQGFISEHEQIKWSARLKVKKEGTNRLETIVRLLKRDMNDLENKLSHKGFRYQVPAPKPELPSDFNP
jgi:hypothetical protein